MISDRYLGGGILGGLGLTAIEPSWPTLAANQVQFLVNTAIGLGSFAVSAILSVAVPTSATFTVPSIGISILPAVLGIVLTTGVIVARGRS